MVMKRIISLFISCIFLSTLIGCENSSRSKSTLNSGQSLKLSDYALVCSSKDNLDEMLLFINQKNDDAQNQMIASGKAKILPKGTKVNIISIGTNVEIETSDNEKWFAPMEVVK